MRLASRAVRRPFLLAGLALLAGAAQAAAQAETTEYYGTDAVGSVRIVFDASGAVLGRQDYDPFGREILAASGVPPERFGGQATDGEAQQAYFHARQLQSRTGRFASVDSVFGGMEDPQAWNRYSYALGNPLRYTDTQGTDPSNGFNPCVDSSSPDCLSDDPFLPGFGGGNDETCPITAYFHGGLCGDPPRGGHPPTPPTDPTPPADPPADPPKPPAPPKPTNPTIDWDYWYGFWQGFKSEFSKGSCADEFFQNTVDNLNPFSFSASSFGESGAAYLAANQYNAAVAYAASRPNYLGGVGLIYARRSIPLQKMLYKVQVTANAGTLISVDAAILQSFATEMYDMYNGQCR